MKSKTRISYENGYGIGRIKALAEVEKMIDIIKESGISWGIDNIDFILLPQFIKELQKLKEKR